MVVLINECAGQGNLAGIQGMLFENLAHAEFVKRGTFDARDLEDTQIAVDWRTPLSAKYTRIQEYILSMILSLYEKCKGRELCYTGALAKATIHAAADQNVEDNVIPGPNNSYVALYKLRCLNGVKLGHLRQMFDNYIPASDRFPFPGTITIRQLML